jgi:pyridoxine 5-phosphate synthase
VATKLSVNINKVATLRNTRPLGIPSVVHCAKLALEAGAAGITIHPRPDQRHIRAADVQELADLLKKYPHAEFNIEGNPFHEFMPHIRAVKPTQCTLVPDAVDAPTSSSGWQFSGDGSANMQRLRPLIAEMKSLGCRVSLFMDADSRDLERAKELGADRIELYTEPYAAAFVKGGKTLENSLTQFANAARTAARSGLGVNAGHDLNLPNLPVFLSRVPGIEEVSIGHALIADALEFGLAETVRRYVAACNASPTA